MKLSSGRFKISAGRQPACLYVAYSCDLQFMCATGDMVRKAQQNVAEAVIQAIGNEM